MIFNCPYCGPRGVIEFVYHGDADAKRPDNAETDQDAWNAYVYDRGNPAGTHREIWQHAGGCRKHVVVTRDTVTHAVSDVRLVESSPA